jgi:hypothetical protein
MTEEFRFRDILDGFSDRFRKLESMMKENRQALFQSQGGGVTAGSEVEQDRLYGTFLGIIQRQLNKMPKQWWGSANLYLDWWRGMKAGRH